jgi:hypothetical protein
MIIKVIKRYTNITVHPPKTIVLEFSFSEIDSHSHAVKRGVDSFALVILLRLNLKLSFSWLG